MPLESSALKLILSPLLGYQQPTNPTRAYCPIYIRTGRVSPAAPQAVLALQQLTNRREGEADVPSEENGRLWGTGKNKDLRRTSSMGFMSQGPPPAEGCVSAATKSFATGTSSLAAFPSLSLTPLRGMGCSENRVSQNQTQ